MAPKGYNWFGLVVLGLKGPSNVAIIIKKIPRLPAKVSSAQFASTVFSYRCIFEGVVSKERMFLLIRYDANREDLISAIFSRSTVNSLELKLATTAEELKATNESLEAKVSDPKLKDQERQINELTSKIQSLESEKVHLKSLLDEAAIDLKSEQEENDHLAQTVNALQV